MKKVNFFTNLGGLNKSSYISRLILNALVDNFEVNLPLYGQSHAPGAIGPQLNEWYQKMSIPGFESDTNLFFGHPNNWHADPKKHNIGILGWETSKTPHRDLLVSPTIHPSLFNWTKLANSVQEIWSLSRATKAALETAGVTVPIKVIYPAIDTKFWTPGEWKSERPIIGVDNDTNGNPLTDKFIVGFVGSWSHRNDVPNLIKIVMASLPANDTVLVLKVHTTKGGITREALSNTIKKIKTEMFIPALPNIVLIDDYMPDNEYRGLLNRLNVYLSISKGEHMNTAAIEAMALGKLAILPMHTGNLEIMKHKETGFAVGSLGEFVYTPDEGLMQAHPYYSADQLWSKVNELDVCSYLQTIHKEWRTDKTVDKFRRMGTLASEHIHKTYGDKQFSKFLETYK